VSLPLQDEPKPSSSRQSPRNSESSRLDFLSMPSRAFEKAEELARRVWAAGWMVVHHYHLPKWLRDNDFLVKGHRPPMNSYWKCFKSVFRVHTETGNIWTHLLGMNVDRIHVNDTIVITFCVSCRRRKMYIGNARLYLCVCLLVCLSVPRRIPTLLHRPGCNLGEW